MSSEDKFEKENNGSKLFTPEGKPIKVLSTSLGIALLANAFLVPGGTALATGSGTAAGDEPKLVEWSSEEVKQYFDKNVDWNLPLPLTEAEEQDGGATGAAEGSASGGGTTIINHYGGGFGWDDMLLYHLLFNSGSNYSSSGWNKKYGGYYAGTTTPYQPRNYSSGSFQNKPVAGSVVPPKTSTSTKGSIIRRSTSSSPGGIGGKSSNLGSTSSGTKSGTSGSVSGSSSSKSSGGKGFFGG